ncbi:MAG: LL-diaminopimelate aminotransferase [Elusimicrobiota bacterium]|nr:LL-diaminopimelate aminotransferase [Elusimicrobiota bacterium]
MKKSTKEFFSNRLKKLPSYLFIEIDRKKKELESSGADIISLGVGDPDLPTPEHIVKAAQEALTNTAYHQYPFGPGTAIFRQAIAKWYKSRFDVELNPEEEIHALIGSKEGLAHLPLAVVNPGEYVLVPDPGYPVYRASVIFAGAKPYPMPLISKNNFIPELTKIPKSILAKTRLMFLNYPNNPTGVTATRKFFVDVVRFAKRYNIIVAHDIAYSEIYFDEENPPISFLSTPGAKDVGVEFHSLSKTYNMTGWRCGWVSGNSQIVKALSKVKDNFDSGVFAAIQHAAVVALTSSQDCVEEMRKIYKLRRDTLVSGLSKIHNWKVKLPKTTFYVWAEIPKKYTSIEVTEKLLTEANVLATPGVGMGKYGEGYVRFALTVDIKRIEEAVRRINNIKW